MNEAILNHLGVALLGRWGCYEHGIPSAMRRTYNAYRADEKHFIDLLNNVPLKQYILESELELSNDFIGRASLVALAMLLGELPYRVDLSYIDYDHCYSRLWNIMRARIRLRKK